MRGTIIPVVGLSAVLAAALSGCTATVASSGGTAPDLAGAPASISASSQPGGAPSSSSLKPPPIVAPKLTPFPHAQPDGFTLTQVPSGFVVQKHDGSTLVLAAPENLTPWEDFVDKVVVRLASTDEAQPAGQATTVHGEAGILHRSAENVTLHYVDSGRPIVIQAWSSVGLSDQDLLEFADGLTASPSGPSSRG